MPGASPREGNRGGIALTEPVGKNRFRGWIARRGIRALMVLYNILLKTAKIVTPRKRPISGGYDILLTGTFHSDNWVMSHLKPLAMSTHCARLRVVSSVPIPSWKKLEVVIPPGWLTKALGRVPARLLMFLWVGIRTKPDAVGGFHLLFNGLAASLLARIVGARSVYFCVGGPAEVKDGGAFTENRLFDLMGAADSVVERQLLRSVAAVDLVVTMGSRAVRFFRERGVDTQFRVISGGIDTRRFTPAGERATIDILLVARLVRIKRIDLFLHAIRLVREELPTLKATIVGDGPLRKPLEELSSRLGLEGTVDFVGQQENVENWLQRARVFVLTSESEGLSLALIEAMLCGLPAVVSQVGDLPDLVADGVNGYLIPEPTPEAFAVRLVELLRDDDRLSRFSEASRRSAERYGMEAAKRLWDEALSSAAFRGCKDTKPFPRQEIRQHVPGKET